MQAQTPKEIALKVIDSTDDFLNEGIDLMYSYSFRKRHGDEAIKKTTQIKEYCNCDYQNTFMLETSASVHFSVTPKEDDTKVKDTYFLFPKGEDLKVKDVYFLFTKEENKWVINNFLTITNTEDDYQKTLLKGLEFYQKQDYNLGKREQEDIDRVLSRLAPKNSFEKDYIKKQNGIAIERALDIYFYDNVLSARVAAYIISYYNPSAEQLEQLKTHLKWPLRSQEEQITYAKSVTADLEKEIKRMNEEATSIDHDIVAWLYNQAESLANYNIEGVDFVGFRDDRFKLSFSQSNRQHNIGLLYISDKTLLPNITKEEYYVIEPLYGNWYFFKSNK